MRSSERGMSAVRIRYRKRRNLICRILRRTAAVIIGIGIIGALGMSWRSLAGMSSIRDAGWVPISLIAMAAGYVIGRTARYIERRRMNLDKTQRKTDKK